MQKIIKIEKGVTRMPAWRMAEPVDFELDEGEHIAIVGPNGGGKSMFVDILTGKHPLLMRDPEYDFAPSKKPLVSDNIKYITFRDSYGDSDGAYYLQQRWNQHDIDETTPTVRELLEEAFKLSGVDDEERREMQKHLYSLFRIEPLLDKYIILLSSGEVRKFQLTKALLSAPRVLIMDNPFIGLDVETRDLLKELLSVLSKEKALQIILVLSKIDDMPDFITHVIEIKDMKVGRKATVSDFFARKHAPYNNILGQEKETEIINLPYKNDEYNCTEIVKASGVCIRYGERVILKDLDWTVFNGERWALSGQNGAGKSTLLSLVCADNPQSYACDISLFGNRRGSGESIWDIKKHIGYVSPEMHRAYNRDIPAIRVVASGLKDSVGLYAKPDEEEYETCKWWMEKFGVAELADTSFLKLSSGEQRLVLLVRAFVKDPELLILDEPFHGLDNRNKQLVTEIIEAFCKRRNKTLIIVTHYMDELPPCVNKKLMLKRNA